MWPFKLRIEDRQSGGVPFSDAVVEAIVSAAGGTTPADPTAIAALEAAAGLYARCFAGAEVNSETVTPAVRALIARDLIRRGESVHLIDLTRGRVSLIPCGSWDVRGPWKERSWWYRVDTFGPSGNATHFVLSQAVVHARYAVDPARPWHGISPLGWARATGTLAANLEQRLGEEAGAAVAHLLPAPPDGGSGEDDDPLAGLKADIRLAKGRTVLVETTSAGWGEGRMAAPHRDWEPHRIGANPPETLPTLRTDAFEAVLGACGVPVSLFTDADGTSQRESFCRFLTTAIMPLADFISEETNGQARTPIRFRFEGLYAHDLAGRTQALDRLVSGGVELERALRICGLG